MAIEDQSKSLWVTVKRVALYHERWELELCFDEVKTELPEREEALRSKTPRDVAQDLWSLGLLYNLVRLEIEHIAAEDRLGPTPHQLHRRAPPGSLPIHPAAQA
jgi:hypothetical protein